MTTQEKIDVLERAITKISHDSYPIFGVCRSVFESIYSNVDNIDKVYDGREWDIEAIEWLRVNCQIELPEQKYSLVFCWPLTPEGDEQRRAFLQKRIDELKSEL